MASETTETEIEYPSSDGKPVAESDIHINVLLDIRERLKSRYADRSNVYAAGNMLVYYEEGNPYKVLAPDVFVVFGVPKRLRDIFKTWEEGAFPAVVFEITSKTTRSEDMDTKYEVYRDTWKVREYFLFDPTEEYLDPSLLGYRRVRDDFVPIRPRDGTITSRVLGITLSRDGDRLILTDSISGMEVLTTIEQKAVEAEQKAVEAEQKAVEAERSALSEKTTRELVEAENAKLKTELAAVRRKRS